jgi:hypothetical protein
VFRDNIGHKTQSKNTIQKTKNMSRTDLTKKPRVESKEFLLLIRHSPYYFLDIKSVQRYTNEPVEWDRNSPNVYVYELDRDFQH